MSALSNDSFDLWLPKIGKNISGFEDFFWMAYEHETSKYRIDWFEDAESDGHTLHIWLYGIEKSFIFEVLKNQP